MPVFTSISSEYCAYEMRHIICSLKIDMRLYNCGKIKPSFDCLWECAESVTRGDYVIHTRIGDFSVSIKFYFSRSVAKKVIWKRTEKKRVSPRFAPRPLKINTARRLLPKNIPFYSCKGSFWIFFKANLNSNSRSGSPRDLI